tara:strand:+ start:838 stop:1074 length:237 start_codon:yes stop_codon:yes gene_type:complete
MADESPANGTPLEGARRRASTATSSFGVSRREGHDASVYYTSRLNEGLVSSRDVGAAQAFPEERLSQTEALDLDDIVV